MKHFLKFSWNSIKLALRVYYGCFLIVLILLPFEIVIVLSLIKYSMSLFI